MKGKLTITYPNLNSQEDGLGVMITVTEANSGVTITQLEISPVEFTNALSSLGHRPCDLKVVVGPDSAKLVGKVIETMRLGCPKLWEGKEAQSAEVQRNFAKRGLQKDGWRIFHDGTHSRQDGETHEYIVRRYVDPTPKTDED